VALLTSSVTILTKRACGPNIFGGNAIFALNLFWRHATSKAANDNSDRNSSAPYYGLAMTDHRVNRDPIIGYHCFLLCVLRGWKYRREAR
jgi:hypothetical protein